jgi:hypothetical protein
MYRVYVDADELGPKPWGLGEHLDGCWRCIFFTCRERTICLQYRFLLLANCKVGIIRDASHMFLVRKCDPRVVEGEVTRVLLLLINGHYDRRIWCQR